MLRISIAAAGLVTLAACNTTTTVVGGGANPDAKDCKLQAECAVDGLFCDATESKCITPPPGRPLGDGSSPVTFTEVLAINNGAREDIADVAFNPSDPTQVWALGYGTNAIHIIEGLPDAPAARRILDPAAAHFLHKPPAIAFGLPNEWASCGDNDNSQNDRGGMANYFMGPSLWTTDAAILGKATAGGLGSHIDMLHATPFCRGIVHVEERWFWVFNAHDQSLDKYSFAEPHAPGADDHSDGQIFRYAKGQVKGAVDGTPSHLAYDPADGMLYAADTGNQRVVKLDTASGTKGGPLPRRNEPLVANAMMNDSNVEVLAEGLAKPSGIELKNGTLYVSDAETSTFYAYDKTGKEIRRLATDLPAGSLAGFTFGPDGKIWFVDRKGGRLVRIDAW